MKCFDCKSLLQQSWFWYGIWFYVITGLGTLATWFNMYSYDMFISGYGVSTLDILWVQLVFAVWNVLNDLIAGYFSDWYNARFGGRLILIIPFNILWCLATVIPYYELGIRPYSLHYLLYVCLNDGFFSVQAIVTSAVWVDDLTKDENERVKLSLVTKPIGFVVGFVIIWFSYLFWDKDDLQTFHVLYWSVFIVSVFFTFLSFFALRYLLKKYKLLEKANSNYQLLEHQNNSQNETSTLVESSIATGDKHTPLMAVESMMSIDKSTDHEISHSQLEDVKLDDSIDYLNVTDKEPTQATFSMKIFFKDILHQPNLWYFIIPSVINEFQGIFLGQYRPIFVDAFLDVFDEYFRSTYISILTQGGVVIEMAILLISIKMGCAYFVRLGILIRLITAICGVVVLVILYMAQYPFEWNVYIAIFTMFWLFSFQIGFIFFLNFFNMVMANLVYEMRAYRIKNGLIQLTSMTSMYWAIHACFAKPFNGVGTIIGTYFLEEAGYGGSDGEANYDDLDDATKGRVKYTLLQLTSWFMLATSLIQYVFFRNYDLEDKKLAEVERIVNKYDQKEKLRKAKYDQDKLKAATANIEGVDNYGSTT